jgi:predicted porin
LYQSGAGQAAVFLKLLGENTMIKKILPTMIGAALAGSMTVASADITVFGHLDSSVDFTDQDGGSDAQNLNCNTCSLGFKGSEDLGNGLKAIFKLDFQFDMTERQTSKAKGIERVQVVNTAEKVINPADPTGPLITVFGTTEVDAVREVKDDSAITDRDQWLGLAGNFGQIRFGTISTIYKSHGAMIDPVYRTSVQARAHGLQSKAHSGAGEQGQGRAEDTFRYDSPSWNGLKIGATYTMQTETQVNNSSDTPYSAGVQYKNGPFLVFADYITNDRGGDDSAYKAGGKWTFGNYSLYGQYEFDDGLLSFLDGAQFDKKGDGADVWELGGTAQFGNNMLVVAYGEKDSTSWDNFDNDDDFGATETFEIVGVHSMSKRTSIYGGYVNRSFDGHFYNENDVKKSFTDQDIVTLGMKHKF